jgi:hypothetical protein
VPAYAVGRVSDYLQPAKTIFNRLHYDSVTNTSVLHCETSSYILYSMDIPILSPQVVL